MNKNVQTMIISIRNIIKMVKYEWWSTAPWRRGEVDAGEWSVSRLCLREDWRGDYWEQKRLAPGRNRMPAVHTPAPPSGQGSGGPTSHEHELRNIRVIVWTCNQITLVLTFACHFHCMFLLIIKSRRMWLAGHVARMEDKGMLVGYW
jgi:hypothetical protein